MVAALLVRHHCHHPGTRTGEGPQRVLQTVQTPVYAPTEPAWGRKRATPREVGTRGLAADPRAQIQQARHATRPAPQGIRVRTEAAFETLQL
jgi:hypothetical protein